MMIVHMVMRTVCIWACDAHAAMQVSNPEGYASIHYSCWPETEPVSTHYAGCEKLDCRGVAIADYDTSAHLVTQAYGCSAYEALGSVAAPYVSDKHHDKMKI